MLANLVPNNETSSAYKTAKRYYRAKLRKARLKRKCLYSNEVDHSMFWNIVKKKLSKSTKSGMIQLRLSLVVL